MTIHAIGSIHRQPVGALADKAAIAVMEHRSPRALTLDPAGHLALEPVRSAAEDDIVGVYQGDMRFTLARNIEADLRFEIERRQLRPRKVRHVRRMNGERRAA